jgi:hypothetical protein
MGVAETKSRECVSEVASSDHTQQPKCSASAVPLNARRPPLAKVRRRAAGSMARTWLAAPAPSSTAVSCSRQAASVRGGTSRIALNATPADETANTAATSTPHTQKGVGRWSCSSSWSASRSWLP